MHGKKSKKQSKRITLRKKYKIRRKVRDHERKTKKEKKKNVNKTWRSNRDPGVPNKHPFKAAILEEAMAAKHAALRKKKLETSKPQENTTPQNDTEETKS